MASDFHKFKGDADATVQVMMAYYKHNSQRGNQRRLSKPGENTYKIHIDLYSYVSVFVRIMKCDDAEEQRKTIRAVA